MPIQKSLTILWTVSLVGFASAQTPGQTARYWDCCKPSCGWTANVVGAHVNRPVATCAANGVTVLPLDQTSGCLGEPAFACNNNQPWAIDNTLAYGYAAVYITGGSEVTWCCACYELVFTSIAIAGRRMIVQATNTGADLGHNHFDIQIPGGGVGIYNGCTPQWNAPYPDGWGARYGGVSSRAECDALPAQIRDGCYWRFDWMLGVSNPAVTFTPVACPAELTSRSMCARQ